LKIIGLADPEVESSLRGAGIGMSVDEARSIAQVLGRDPTLTELFCYDAMWSEHCSYKSSRATLKEFLPTNGAWSYPMRATTIPVRSCQMRGQQRASGESSAM